MTGSTKVGQQCRVGWFTLRDRIGNAREMVEFGVAMDDIGGDEL